MVGCQPLLNVDPNSQSTYVVGMKSVTIDIADPIYKQFVEQARLSNRQPSELISEALGRYLEHDVRTAAAHSVLDIQSFPLGPPSTPWTTRAEMLEGFMDDRG
jgi:hypothetical protein